MNPVAVDQSAISAVVDECVSAVVLHDFCVVVADFRIRVANGLSGSSSNSISIHNVKI